MAEVDDLTVAYEEDGHEIVQELGKSILSKGAWSTIVYLYQEWDGGKEEYSKKKITIRRYQKRNGEYRQKSKFNLSSIDQAKKLNEILAGWIADEE
ncbi:MAG: hypothetical protein ACI9OJ_003871 [Myxococcota bacterium]|jgi:hypothetical protein